jgi:hypothetical protein
VIGVIAASGGNLVLAAFPLGAAAIAAVFAWVLLGRFVSRRRPFEGIWGLAMVMFAVASTCVFLGVGWGWTVVEYRLYWLLGAVLNVPLLALGEVYLLASRRVASVLLGVMVLVAGAATWIVIAATPHTAALGVNLPLGLDVWGSASAAYQLRWLSWIGYVALIGGIVWSATRMRGRPELRDRTVGTLWVGIGATVVAIGSGVGAGLNVVPLFAVGLAVGIAAMFWGFRRAGRRSAAPAT